jgi:hypothetical protein
MQHHHSPACNHSSRGLQSLFVAEMLTFFQEDCAQRSACDFSRLIDVTKMSDAHVSSARSRRRGLTVLLKRRETVGGMLQVQVSMMAIGLMWVFQAGRP